MIANIKEALLSLMLALFPGAQAEMPAEAPQFDVTGNYVIAMEYLGTDYLHDLRIEQDAEGNLTGSGGSPAGANVYTWTIVDGEIEGNEIDIEARYTATADAVTPTTTLLIEGEIATNGTMSGTWSDNYQGGSRIGTWESVSGTATPIVIEEATLTAEDFGVVNYDTGLGILKGYTAGFKLDGATFDDVESITMKLYSGTKLLQTNTATDKIEDLTGSQFSSPFDVSGSFNYEADGYWDNDRQREYGQSRAATKVVATVTLEDGTVLTAVNTNLTGDPLSVMPHGDDDDDNGTTTPKEKNKEDMTKCKKDGWKALGFKNQGKCVSDAVRSR